METATQELIFQIMSIVISLGVTALGIYVKKFITTKIDVTKYGFENDRVERILDNAINYAEAKAIQTAKDRSLKLTGSTKLTIAKGYIDRTDPKIIEKYGSQINEMLSSKVIQALGIK